MPLLRCEAIQASSLVMALLNSFSRMEHVRQVHLGVRTSLN
jgi:hypothetical protein